MREKIETQETLRIIGEITKAIATAKEITRLPSEIAEYCREIVDAELASLWLVVEERDSKRRLVPSAFLGTVEDAEAASQKLSYDIYDEKHPPSDPQKPYDGVTGYVAQSGESVHVRSFEELQREYGFCWKGKWDSIQHGGQPERNFRSLYAVPIRLRETILGVLKVENKRNSGEGFTAINRQTIDLLSDFIALAIDTYRSRESQDRKVRQALTEFNRALLQEPSSDTLPTAIVRKTAELVKAEMATLFVLRDATTLILSAQHGFLGDVRKSYAYELDWQCDDDSKINGLTAWVAIRKQSYRADSYQELSEHPSHRGTWDLEQWENDALRRFQCLYAVPLIGTGGQVRGVLKVENSLSPDRRFSESDERVVDIMADYITLVLEMRSGLKHDILVEIAHLARSPLAGAVTNLNLLTFLLDSGQEVSIDQIRSELATVSSALSHAGLIIMNLTALSPDTSTTPTGGLREDVNPDMFITNILQVFRDSEPEFKFIFNKISVPQHFFLSKVEQTNFQIILFNIIHNAVKFSRDDHRVEVSIDRAPKGLILAIRDYGIGIPPEDKEHIFERFWRKSRGGDREGVGVGLYNVKHMIDNLRWNIEVESEPGKGSIFKVIIPIQVTTGDNYE